MRQKYKLIHWDYGTNRGVATDGTRFEGEPILFEVRQEDLEPEHDGHLLMGEVFSAYEDSAGDHHLYDILIEEGARAIAVPAYQQPVQAIDDEQAAAIVADTVNSDPDPFIRTIRSVVEYRRASDKTLEERVSKLEKDLNELWNKVFGDEESR